MIRSRPITFAFVAIIEPIFVNIIIGRFGGLEAYLKPCSLYASDAYWIMCAVADFPAPPSMNLGSIVVFNMFPVKMKVLDADLGSCSKPRTACCAATKGPVVLILISRVKFAKGIENGFFGSSKVAALASRLSVAILWRIRIF
jgi:hypothetical protein